MPNQFPTTPAPGTAAPGQTAVGTPSATPAPADVASAREVYLGLREKREVLRNVKSRLEDEREEIVNQLRQGTVSDADKAGLDQRLAGVDQQIAKTSIDIAEADAQVAAGAAVPGAIQEEPRSNPWEYGPPVEIVAMGLAITGALLLPVSLAWARRLWRKANVVSAVPPELNDRVASIERNLETVALEIERIGEGQRFVTQLLAQREMPAPAVLPSSARRDGA